MSARDFAEIFGRGRRSGTRDPTNRYVSRHARTRDKRIRERGTRKRRGGVLFRGDEPNERGRGGCRRTRSRGSALGALARLRRRGSRSGAKPGHRPPPTHLAGFALAEHRSDIRCSSADFCPADARARPRRSTVTTIR